MQTQITELNFEGQKVFIGIDVHLKSWNISIFTERLHHKTFNQAPNPEVLNDYLRRNFPNATYLSVYEAGFCGLSTHYKLVKLGIQNIVVNPADVPTTQKEQMHKTDSVDSNKLGRSLRNNELKGIYIPQPITLEDRTLIRVRSAIVKDLIRIKNRIKSMLHFYGIELPTEFQSRGTHWSNRFMKWLKEIQFHTSVGTDALRLWITEAEQQRLLLLEASRKIRVLSRSETYAENITLITSIPGVGLTTGMLLLTEIENIDRFEKSDKLVGLVGVVPTCHASGDNDQKGEITPRGQDYLRKALIEASWVAIRKDPALYQSFHQYCKRMDSNLAITRIARKLINRIYVVLKYKRKYEYSKLK